MSSIDQDLLLKLLKEEAQHLVKFHQDGVVLKGNPHDDKRNFPGTLLLVLEEELRPATGTTLNQMYVIWVPYSYLLCLAPHLVSPLARRSITDADLVELASKESRRVMKMDWMFSICVPLSRIAKIQRKSNLRGKRIVTLCRVGGSTECPLIFQDGGMTRFFDEIKKLAAVKAVSADEFSIEVKAPTATVTSPGSPSLEALREELYAPPKSQGSKGVMSHVLNFGAALSRGGSKIADVLFSNSPTDITVPQFSGGGSETYDICEPVIEVDQIVPVVKHIGTRTLAPLFTAEEWHSLFDAEEGRIDAEGFRRARLKLFGGKGIDPSVRYQVWCYLLEVYPLQSTRADRDLLDRQRTEKYVVMKRQWESMLPEQEVNFSAFRERKGSIEKDVVRTDRQHPAFEVEGGAKLTLLYNLLMTYSMYNFDLGYCQGMSDLAAILILTHAEYFENKTEGNPEDKADAERKALKDEVEVFSLFRCLMQQKCEGNFRSDVKTNMAKQLNIVEHLTKKFVPQLYAHLEKRHAENMTFVFRWLLVLFKREFISNEDVMTLWDTILSSPHTPQFEIFVTVALVQHVAPQMLEQSLSYDELLKFTNRMSGMMKVEDVLLISLEFYDYVANMLSWKSRVRAGEGVVRPKLDDVIEAIKQEEINRNNNASSPKPSPSSP